MVTSRPWSALKNMTLTNTHKRNILKIKREELFIFVVKLQNIFLCWWYIYKSLWEYSVDDKIHSFQKSHKKKRQQTQITKVQ